jgi:tRNA (cmo5U34)-methyltransferase
MNSSSWKEKVVVDSFLNGKRGAIPFATDQLNIMLKLLSHLNNEISSFIDIGAGDGVLSHLLLERYNSANGVLVDFSLPMIDAAKNRLEKYKHRIKIINADISNTNWQENIFSNNFSTVDAIISGYCIHHLPHGRKYELYQEIYNHLSPNGIFVNIEHVASKSSWGEKISDDLFIESLYSFESENKTKKTIEEVGNDFHNRPDKKDNILLST